ncbi:MAG: adenylate/guanylate cyclase domain-containing protein [Hyphomicrobiaceae bacterium]|nr:adenylate/guanylate cyclase domain-containing protein [Hyphomicrobiaceae bacterium]
MRTSGPGQDLSTAGASEQEAPPARARFHLAVRFLGLLAKPLRPVLDGLARLAETGTGSYPPDTKRRLMILNMFAYLIVLTTVGFALQYGLTESKDYRPLVLINIAIAVVVSLVPLAHRINEIAGGLVIVVTEFVALTAITRYLGHDAGSPLLLMVGAAAPFFVFGLGRIRLVIAVVLGALFLHLYAWFSFTSENAIIRPDPRILNDLYTQTAITAFGLIAVTVWYAFRLVENAKAETDRLLRNILPDSVVERLKRRPGVAIADTFPEASILFSDISGFVPLARELGAARVVELLNRIVLEFDALAERHRIEKIKTIGDAYMAAAGVPEPVPDPTVRLTRLAFDMLGVIERLRSESGLDVQIRIGIATGPVMAGVIGSQKFSYDVWGDTVNLAARLENRSRPGRVLVCPLCRDRLDGLFELEPTGEIEIKGVGLKEMYFVVAP